MSTIWMAKLPHEGSLISDLKEIEVKESPWNFLGDVALKNCLERILKLKRSDCWEFYSTDLDLLVEEVDAYKFKFSDEVFKKVDAFCLEVDTDIEIEDSQPDHSETPFDHSDKNDVDESFLKRFENDISRFSKEINQCIDRISDREVDVSNIICITNDDYWDVCVLSIDKMFHFVSEVMNRVNEIRGYCFIVHVNDVYGWVYDGQDFEIDFDVCPIKKHVSVDTKLRGCEEVKVVWTFWYENGSWNCAEQGGYKNGL